MEMRFFLILALALLQVRVQTGALDYLRRNRTIIDCHNCYPNDGAWADRIDRALRIGYPVAIEQDLASYQGRVVVSHTDRTRGGEPLLRDYFFERVRPIVEEALKKNERSRWPLIILHFDFKSNEAPLLHAVWNLLGEYEPWITTATKTADPHKLSRFDVKPLLVLTETPDEQEEVFFREVPVGGRLRLFGSAKTNEITAKDEREHDHLLATLPPEVLLSAPPTNYRRWWNNPWAVVEEGGPPHAGSWIARDERRLRAVVDHAHKLGYWIRFYALDGFTPAENRGWDRDYNFRSREAAAVRWRACFRAGVNLLATDQMEDVAAAIHAGDERPAPTASK
jgi:hypothetical protein